MHISQDWSVVNLLIFSLIIRLYTNLNQISEIRWNEIKWKRRARDTLQRRLSLSDLFVQII